MKIYKKIISYIVVVCTLLTALPVGMAGAEETPTEFDLILEKYKDVAAYTKAVYTGGYDALSLGDEMSDLYAYGYMYSKYVNSRTDFHGYIYKIDEAKQKFGAADSKVVAAESSGAKYYAPKFDNSFRHANDIQDKSGIKKDAWFSTDYFRGDKLAMAGGGISFGIGKGDKISIDDNELVFVFEYFDNGYNPITFQYVNTDWDVGVYATSSYVVPRGDTNKWRTAIMYVNDAKFAPEHDTMRSAFCSGREDFVVRGNDVAISGMMVLKAKDCEGDLYDSSNPNEDEYALGEPVYCPKQVITKNGTTYNFVQIDGKKTIQPYVTNQNWNKDETKFLCGYENLMFEYDTVNETYRFLDVASCNSALHAFVTPDNFIYYMHNKRVYKINWDTYERTLVCQLPEGVNGFSNPTVSNDGKYMTGYYSGRDFGGRLVLLNLETGKIEKVYDRKMYASGDVEISLGHPLVNPGYPNIIFFCGEGIDTNYLHERMFTVDTNTDKMTMIYQQSYVDETYTGEAAGHEVWSMNGDYLYFVKYNLGKTKGTNYVGRIPFRDGVFTGEREIINGDASYWHCYPSGDNNWAVADTNTGEVYLMSAKNHNSYLIADFDMNVSDINHPYQPHPHISYNGKSVNWQMVTDKNDGYSLGVGWVDVSDITSGNDYTQTKIQKDHGTFVGYKNTISDITKQSINGTDYVKAVSGNSIYFDIDDSILKNVHQQLKIKFKAYCDTDDVIDIGYTAAVHDKYEWYRYEDMKISVPSKKGNNEFTLDLGYVNANNICKYATDIYFTSQNGDLYIEDVEIIPYSNESYIDTFDDCIYAFAGGKDDYARGLATYTDRAKMISIDDEDALYKEFDVTTEQATEYKNAGFYYVTEINDNSWLYKSVADTDGITKNAWFTTRCKRVNTTSATTDLPGYIYFSVTNDVIVESDKQLIITIEYLDNRSENFNVLYTTDDGLKSHTITPKNTGKWQTYSFIVDDASFSNTNKTLLATRKEDFRIEAMRKDLYIASVCVEKPGNKEISGITIGKDKVTLDAINKSGASSDVNAFVGVFDSFGVLNRVYKGDSLSIDAASKNQLNADIALGDGERVKVFAFEKNLTPYKTISIDISYNNGNINVSWKKYISDKDVYYKVYMDGSLVCITTNNNYVLPDDQKTHKWNVEAVDFYGKPIE